MKPYYFAKATKHRSIFLKLLFACLISGNAQAGIFDKFRGIFRNSEQQLIQAFKKERIQKATELLKEHPDLAQVRDKKHGWTLAHLAALKANTSLLILANRHGVDMLQQDKKDRTPVELLGEAFMNSCCDDDCKHQDHTTIPPQNAALNRSLQSALGIVPTNSPPHYCRRVRAQRKLQGCMDIFLAQQNVHVDRRKNIIYSSLDSVDTPELIPTELQKLIFTMLPTKHQDLCREWQEDPVSFLENCPTPPLYKHLNGNQDPSQEWYAWLLK